MNIQDTEQCATPASGTFAIGRPALSKLRNHMVVLLCSLWLSAPVWAAEDLGRAHGLISATDISSAQALPQAGDADIPRNVVPLAVTEARQMTIAKTPLEAIINLTSPAVASVNSVALAVASIGSVASKTVLDAAGVIQHGIGSWYGAKFQNKRTANGERFNMNALTAAHPTLPFGTMLCAHSPSTGKSVIVRINDRGPFVKHRIIDFSKAAAQALGILHSRPGLVALLDSSDKRCS